MTLPAAACDVRVTCDVLSSEDPHKITDALESILDDTKATIHDTTADATSKKITSLNRIHKTIQSRASGRAWRRRLRLNTDGNETWVYLNKQAAAVGVIALCSEADESPLGPITLSIRCADIEDVVDWLVPRSE